MWHSTHRSSPKAHTHTHTRTPAPAASHLLACLPACLQLSRSRSSALVGTLLGMAQHMLEQPHRFLLPCAPVGLQGQGEEGVHDQHQHQHQQQQQEGRSTLQPGAASAGAPVSLAPVIALMCALRNVGLRAGLALDMALSTALQRAFLAPHVSAKDWASLCVFLAPQARTGVGLVYMCLC